MYRLPTMESQRRFGDDDPFTPSQAWVQAWKLAVATYWQNVLDDYRSRVSDHYALEANLQPRAFPLASSSEIRIVASLVRYWVFARPSDEDVIWVDERWEHDALASYDVYHHPDDESMVRGVVGLDAEWTLLDYNDIGSLWLATMSEGKPDGNPYKENRSRAGSALVVMRRENGVAEMEILEHMICSYVDGVDISFPDMTAISAIAVASGDGC